MKTFTLKFIGRCKLNAVLASATGGTIGRISALSSVLKQTEFPEALQKQATEHLNRAQRGEPIDADFGAITVELENTEAETLAAEIEDCLGPQKKLVVADYRLWAEDVLAAIRKTP